MVVPAVLVIVVVPARLLNTLVLILDRLVAVKLLVLLKVEPVMVAVVADVRIKLPPNELLVDVKVVGAKLPLAVVPLWVTLNNDNVPAVKPLVSKL